MEPHPPEVQMVPLLPCGGVDELATFWEALGASFPWRQAKPYPYLAVSLAGLNVHYYYLPGHDPAACHSSCLLVVPDTAAWFERLAAGLRAAYGQLPLTGFPRITRPRRRKNADGASGFSLVDPAGNWLRFHATAPSVASDDPLAAALDDAVVIADSKGDPAVAARVLRGRLDRASAASPLLPAAWALLAELSLRADDVPGARDALAKLDACDDVPDEVLAQATDVRAALPG